MICKRCWIEFWPKAKKEGKSWISGNTKAMVISKNGELTGNQHIQKVSSVRYLECWLSSEWNNKEEKVSASSRLEQHLGKFLTSRDLSILLRIRWLRCYVFSTLYYGMKGCTLTKAMRNQLGGFEMCCCRHPEGFNVGINTLTSVQTTFI